MKFRDKYIFTIMIVCLLALVVTGFLIYMHYSGDHSLCDLNKTFACSKVNTSSYSMFMGLPISLLGFLSFLVIFLLTLRIINKKSMKGHFKKSNLINFIFFISLFGAMFQLYLLYIEVFVLKAFCIFCLASETLITLIFFITLAYILQVKKL